MRLTLAILFASTAAAAFQVPPEPRGRVSDYAGALSPDAIARIDARLRAGEQGQTHQVAVAVFRSLGGEPIEEASMAIAERWKIGSRRDDGVLFTLFLDDREMRIEVGYGLEDKLTDAQCKRILRDQVAPRLRAGDLEGGITAGVAAIEAAVGGQAAPPGASGAPQGFDLVGVIVVLLILLLFGLFRGGFLLGWLFGGRGRGRGPFGGGDGGGGFHGGGGSFGGGGASHKW